jgi:Secretion system C-terminal sorting domain
MVTLSYPLANSYFTRAFTSTNAIESYQVIRVPRYYDLKINASKSVTAPAWNGLTGGVVVLDAANTLTIKGSVTVNALGFRGGGGKQLLGATAGNSNGSGVLLNTDYRFNSATTNPANTSGGAKGEGIAGSPIYYFTQGATSTATGTVEGYIDGSMGRGAPGNAGGGGTDGEPGNNPSGNQYNSGGGGGGNGGAGGQGGSGWPSTTGDVTTYPFGGYGGAVFAQKSLQRITMGGGGGAGTANNSSTSNESNCSGGPGGGIIIARAKSYSGNGSLDAGGGNAPGVTTTYSTAQTDAAGGGGAGGSIIVITTQAGATGLGSISASASGGDGGSMTTYYNHGPGGGGGGGIIYTSGTLSSTSVSGGANGLTRSGSTTGPIDNSYGSAPGSNGNVVSLSGAPSFQNVSSASSPCGVLPIILESFTAVLNDKSVVLKWQAENEINFNYFGVEYSTDGVHFSDIGTVNYADGISGYQFIHATPQQGQNFYRLRLVDKDGGYVYSAVLLIQIEAGQSSSLVIYPNPAFDYVTLQFNAVSAQAMAIEIFDNSGKRLVNKNYTAVQGRNYVSIPDIKNLPHGIYLVKVQTLSGVVTEKLVVGK